MMRGAPQDGAGSRGLGQDLLTAAEGPGASPRLPQSYRQASSAFPEASCPSPTREGRTDWPGMPWEKAKAGSGPWRHSLLL